MARARGRAASVRSAAAQQFDMPPHASRAPCCGPPPAWPCQPTTRRRPRRLVSRWARTARTTSLGSSSPPRQQRLDALHQLVAREVAIAFGFIASCERRSARHGSRNAPRQQPPQQTGRAQVAASSPRTAIASSSPARPLDSPTPRVQPGWWRVPRSRWRRRRLRARQVGSSRGRLPSRYGYHAPRAA